jgi:glycosyltransferase involved in cell wall biosynthesis
MQISVVIPVYNAGAHVRQAVESALAQPETGEVFLVEDASPDDSLQICQELEAEYEKVRLLRHPNGENRGAATSRNLGIAQSRCDYITFLDADDFFLPDRFKTSMRILSQQPDIDDVYEAMDLHFETPEDRQRWIDLGRPANGMYAQMPPNIVPEQLFEHLLSRKGGHFHINTLLLRRDLFKRIDGFSDDLHYVEDAIFVYKLATVAKLVGGELNRPVSMLRVHGANRVTGTQRTVSNNQHWRLRGWLDVWQWGRDRFTARQKRMWVAFFLRFINGGVRRRTITERLAYYWRSRYYVVRLLLHAPDVARYIEYWLMYPPRMYGVIHYSRLMIARLRRPKHEKTRHVQ